MPSGNPTEAKIIAQSDENGAQKSARYPALSSRRCRNVPLKGWDGDYAYPDVAPGASLYPSIVHPNEAALAVGLQGSRWLLIDLESVLVLDRESAVPLRTWLSSPSLL